MDTVTEEEYKCKSRIPKAWNNCLNNILDIKKRNRQSKSTVCERNESFKMCKLSETD